MRYEGPSHNTVGYTQKAGEGGEDRRGERDNSKRWDLGALIYRS